MTTFVIEIRKENKWYPVYPGEKSLVQFRTMESAERFLRWVYPQNPDNIRVAPR